MLMEGSQQRRLRRSVRRIKNLKPNMFMLYVVRLASDNMLLQIISLSASANKLSKLKERADEYTALIMEELDRDNLGYIEVYQMPYSYS
jgi:hypothetical protein